MGINHLEMSHFCRILPGIEFVDSDLHLLVHYGKPMAFIRACRSLDAWTLAALVAFLGNNIWPFMLTLS